MLKCCTVDVYDADVLNKFEELFFKAYLAVSISNECLKKKKVVGAEIYFNHAAGPTKGVSFEVIHSRTKDMRLGAEELSRTVH